ncbi:hypothetical protein NDU88_007481 [Pleurodeles waltl]|uniref:Uncharacterized protein n=1 Tax=Pleurodeles waltl TaxID=8319 RepID=A0AAV7PU67_PLEWA|nr:hypothetical protein NDU88_007481 [Pleurodeles waltl]
MPELEGRPSGCTMTSEKRFHLPLAGTGILRPGISEPKLVIRKGDMGWPQGAMTRARSELLNLDMLEQPPGSSETSSHALCDTTGWRREPRPAVSNPGSAGPLTQGPVTASYSRQAGETVLGLQIPIWGTLRHDRLGN